MSNVVFLFFVPQQVNKDEESTVDALTEFSPSSEFCFRFLPLCPPVGLLLAAVATTASVAAVTVASVAAVSVAAVSVAAVAAVPVAAVAAAVVVVAAGVATAC